MNASLSGKLKAANLDTLREIVREAEVYLNAQLTSAIAADARANSFASYLAAAGAVAIGAAYSLKIAAKPDPLMIAISAIVGVLLLVAAALALHSARPIGFSFGGTNPGGWAADIVSGKTLEASLAEMCAYYDGMIENNRKAMEANSVWFERARRLVVLTLGVAGLVFLLALVGR